MLAELHCHTYYSVQKTLKVEGLNSPKEVVAKAKEAGAEFLCITDHDIMTGARHAEAFGEKYGVKVIPSEEVTSGEGDVLALAIQEWIPPNLGVAETLDRVHAQGGVAIAPHPFDLYGAGMREKAKDCDAVEVFNAINLDRLSNARAKRFAKKHRKPMTAGSDAHWIEMMGRALTEVRAEEQTLESFLEAFRKGKVAPFHPKYQSVGVMQAWTLKRFQLSHPNLVDYVEHHYSLPKKIIAKRFLNLLQRSPGKVDYVLKGLSYASVGGAVLYSAFKTVKDSVKIRRK